MADNVKNVGNLWLTISGRYGRVGGKVWWDRQADAPRFVEFNADWPLLRIRLVQQRSRARVQTGIQARPSSWHAHLPRRTLGIPSQFRISATESWTCGRTVGGEHVFDFTGMSPLPEDDLERKAIILLQEVESLRQKHPEVLARLGINVSVAFDDE